MLVKQSGVAKDTEQHAIRADGRTVLVSSPEKVFFSTRGETKLDLINYYLSVAEPFMAAMRGRPTMLQRFPDGAEGNSFYQKRVPAGTPDWVETTTVETPNGTPSNALVLADMAHLVWAVNLGCLGFHPWPYLAADPSNTDELRIDLDPQPGVSFDDVRRSALAVRDVLGELGLTGFPKTTGNRGIHIYVRVVSGYDSITVRYAAVALARELERRHGDFMTAAWWKEERGQRVFIDFNQNAPHKTVFGPWCARSRPGAEVSAPLSWDELMTDVMPEDLTIATVPALVAKRGNPWATMNGNPQSLEPLMELHRRDWANGMLDAPWPPVYPKQPNEPPRVSPSRSKKPATPS